MLGIKELSHLGCSIPCHTASHTTHIHYLPLANFPFQTGKCFLETLLLPAQFLGIFLGVAEFMEKEVDDVCASAFINDRSGQHFFIGK